MGSTVIMRKLKKVWNGRNRLPYLLTEYEPKDIFRADETALFYKAIPATAYAFQGKPVRGSKTPKDRLTLLLCGNMNGTEKLQHVVIGRVKQSTALKRKYSQMYHYN